uniref:Uncharacterized protein n=1 Tax=viral metagenome TaxID=1070528 RepID=A0A6H1Z786_9ZZZZ
MYENIFIPNYTYFKAEDLERLYSIYTVALLGEEISEVERKETIAKMSKIQQELNIRKGKEAEA